MLAWYPLTVLYCLEMTFPTGLCNKTLPPGSENTALYQQETELSVANPAKAAYIKGNDWSSVYIGQWSLGWPKKKKKSVMDWN